MMIKKIDSYLIRQFLTVLIMALLGFVVIFLVVDLIENLDRFIDNSVPGKIVFRYYLYTLPWFLNIGFPMATLIATVFSFGIMVKRNELTAMKSTGISLYRLALPLLLLGLILSWTSYELENKIVSWGNEKRFEIEREHLKNRPRRSVIRMKRVMHDVFLQKMENTHIAIEQYNPRQQSGKGLTVVLFENGLLSRRIDSKKITWIDTLTGWALEDYSVRSFTSGGMVSDVEIAAGDTLMQLSFEPGDISKQFKSPDELNFEELTARIALLKENGVKTTRWEVARYFKVSFAFTNLIVILFGLPLVVLKQKGGLSFGAGMSVFVIFGFYAFIKFGHTLGYKGILAPLPAAWIGNVVFIIGGILLLILVRK